jgi:hypothetical protein
VNFSPFVVLPPGEQAGQSHGLAITALDPGGDGFARAPVRLKDGLGRHDAVACPFPRVPKTRLGGRRFAARIEGVATQFQIGRPMRNQTEAAGQGFTFRYGFITSIPVGRHADEQALVLGPDIDLAHRSRRSGTEGLEQTLGVPDVFVMGAHGEDSKGKGRGCQARWAGVKYQA